MSKIAKSVPILFPQQLWQNNSSQSIRYHTCQQQYFFFLQFYFFNSQGAVANLELSCGGRLVIFWGKICLQGWLNQLFFSKILNFFYQIDLFWIMIKNLENNLESNFFSTSTYRWQLKFEKLSIAKIFISSLICPSIISQNYRKWPENVKKAQFFHYLRKNGVWQRSKVLPLLRRQSPKGAYTLQHWFYGGWATKWQGAKTPSIY